MIVRRIIFKIPARSKTHTIDLNEVMLAMATGVTPLLVEVEDKAFVWHETSYERMAQEAGQRDKYHVQTHYQGQTITAYLRTKVSAKHISRLTIDACAGTLEGELYLTEAQMHEKEIYGIPKRMFIDIFNDYGHHSGSYYAQDINLKVPQTYLDEEVAFKWCYSKEEYLNYLIEPLQMRKFFQQYKVAVKASTKISIYSSLNNMLAEPFAFHEITSMAVFARLNIARRDFADKFAKRVKQLHDAVNQINELEQIVEQLKL